MTTSVRYIRDSINGSDSNSGNIWSEIQALDANGVNVALNKTVTGSAAQDPDHPYSLIVDGIHSTSNFGSTSAVGLQSVTVDLGSVMAIASITVWHYSDNRAFQSNKREVSVDGVNWGTIFDSAVSGVYNETDSGHTIISPFANGVTTGSIQINTNNALGAKVLKYFPLDGTQGEIVSGSAVTLGGGSFITDATYGKALQAGGTGPAATMMVDLSAHNVITLAFRAKKIASDKLLRHGGDIQITGGASNGAFELNGIDPASSNTDNLVTNHGGGWSGTYWDYTYRNLDDNDWHYHVINIDNRGEGVPHGYWATEGIKNQLNGGFGNAPDVNFRNSTLEILVNAGDAAIQKLAIFSGTLTDAEITSLTSNPDQIVQAAVAATAPAAPTNVIATASDGAIDVNCTPGANNGAAILDYTATTSGGQTATSTTLPIHIVVPNGTAQTVTVKARNSVGLSPSSAPSNSVTPQAGVIPARPVVPGYTVKIYGDAAGDDFNTPAAVEAWTNSQSTVPADNGPFIVFCRKDLDISGRQFGPGWSEAANVGFLRPFPGMGRADLEAGNVSRNITVNTPGIKLIVGSDARIKVGLFLEGFNIIQTAGRLIFRRDGWGQGGSDCGWRNCRMLSTSSVSAVVSGEYANGYVCEDNLIIQDSASTAGVVDTFSGTTLRTTVVRRGAGVGSPAFTGSGVFARDCVFSGCGGTPITAPGQGDHNYTDTALTNNENGKITYSPGQFFESSTDLRPAAGSLMINGASQYAVSTPDATGSNRGPNPDAGAFQRTSAVPLVGITGEVHQDGASLVGTFQLTGNPSSGVVSIVPSASPDGAQGQTIPIVLSGSNNSIGNFSIDDIVPGSYGQVTVSFVNGGGIAYKVMLPSFVLPGVGNLVYDTGGIGDPVAPTEPTVLGPTLSIVTPDTEVMDGKNATVQVSVNLQGDPTGKVEYFVDPQPSGAALGPFAVAVNGSVGTLTRSATAGKVRYRVRATANDQIVSATTGDITTITATALNGKLPA